MTKKTKITGGLYLVLNPAMEMQLLLSRLRSALEGGLQLLQIWNNWPPDYDHQKKKRLIAEIMAVCEGYSVPVLINEEWELLPDSRLSGVHFDEIPEDFQSIKKKLPDDVIIGITCGNDLRTVAWADQQGLDYISFCAMFPSSSAGDCEIVSHDTLQKARSMTDLPLFVSGGITPENLPQLKELDISGVAVISGIMNHNTSKQAALAYAKALNDLKDEKFTAK